MNYQIKFKPVRIITVKRSSSRRSLLASAEPLTKPGWRSLGLVRYGLAGLTGLIALAAVGQSNLYVATNGVDDDAAGRGQSWSAPYLTISNGVAHAGTAGDTVWVSNGAYLVTTQINIMNRITVMSTNGYSNTLVYAGWPTYTTRCFYVANTGVVDGFTISNGYFMGSNNYSGGGGAFVTSRGTIQNCYFRNNICSNSGVDAGGGGVFITNGTVSNCTFYSNTCYTVTPGYTYSHGAAVLIYGGWLLDSTVISNYKYGTWPGAVGYIDDKGETIVSNCLIACNGGDDGAGIWGIAGYGEARDCRIYNCIVSNHAERGGVFVRQTLVQNCLFTKNMDVGVASAYGCMLTNCIIVGNKRRDTYRFVF